MNAALNDAARLYAAGDYAEAEAVCQAIIRDDPHHFDALHLLGVLLTLQHRPEEAVAALRRAESERRGHAQLRVNLGNALLAADRFAEAAIVSGAPGGDAAALNNLGLAYRGLERHADAADAFRCATEARWDHAPSWFNLATTLVRLNRLEAALQAATTALRIAPLDTPLARLADVSNEIARTLVVLGRPEEALATCRRFLKRHPGETSVLWNMSLCLLLLGQFDEGWRSYEHRFDVGDHGGRPDGAIVLDPAQVAGRRVLILTEQGRGDMLQFIRYARLLAERGAIVCVQAYPDLVQLLAATPWIEAVVSTDDQRPTADLVTCVMSLPLAFGHHPANVPYLYVPPERTITDLGPRIRPRIGIAWSGSRYSADRSAIPAATLAPLLLLPGFEFHCLQTEVFEIDQAWLYSANPPITLHLHRLGDFADTAVLIAQMDLIVTVDTAIAHLAGGLGKPVNVMLPFSPDWRWMLGRSDSPWYPTARLFRQPARGVWEPVVQAVIDALASVQRVIA